MIEIQDALGVISIAISTFTAIYLAGIWRGKVDSRLAEYSTRLEKFPPEETALMVKTLWDIYVIDALRTRPDLVEHHSPLQLKGHVKALIPNEMKTSLDSLPLANHSCCPNGYLVIQSIGLPAVEKFAKDNKLSIQVAIGILCLYLSERQ